MKKRLLVLTLLPLLFSCGENITSSTSSTIVDSSSSDITSSQESSSKEESSSSESSSSSSSSESSSESSLPQEMQYTTINLDCFEGYSSGYRFQDNIDELLEVININGSLIAENLIVENCYIQVKESKDAAPHPYFTLGSGSYGGELTINFECQTISFISVELEGYSKYISYNDTYSYDEDFAFTLNEQAIDLSDLTLGNTKIVEEELTSPTSSVSLKTLQGKSRLFIRSVTIGYYE